MAEIDFDAVDSRESAFSGTNLENALNWLGGFVSLALIVGLCWWGYQLVMRDVAGIPVVRALEGPMREAPVDPGGRAADHQGLAVNAIAAEGEAEAPASTLILAPASADLASEDVTQDDLAAMVADNELEVSSPALELPPMTNQTENTTLAALDEPSTQPTVSEQVLDQASIIQATLQAVHGDVAAVTENGIVTDLVPASFGGVVSSVVPELRPASLPVAPANPVPVAAPNRPDSSVNAAILPAGTRLAQLGAFASEQIAIDEWERLSKKFELYLSDKTRIIEKAESGGNTFYRLRAHGFSDLNATRQFCSALLAAQTNCIPVVTR